MPLHSLEEGPPHPCGRSIMSDSQHRFSFSLAKDAVYKSGLRSFME